ncbi:hypothetical protein EUTSA_v10017937mg, partial [Eutrema salsugineum]
MDESLTKGLDRNRSNAAIRKSRLLVVEGYDTRLPEDAIKSALKKHLASCGEIRLVMIPKVDGSDVLRTFAVIDIVVEEGAEDKALELNGSDILKHTPDMKVTVYGNGLSEDGIKSALRKHFSSCGEVRTHAILGDDEDGSSSRSAFISIIGEGERGGDGAVEEARKLSEYDDENGWKIEVNV